MSSISDDEMAEFQQFVWDQVSEYMQEEDTIDGLYMTAAVLMKTAIELYSMVLDDEDVIKVMEETHSSIPQLREQVLKLMQVEDKRTLH